MRDTPSYREPETLVLGGFPREEWMHDNLAATPDKTVLSLTSVSKMYGNFQAVENIDLDVKEHQLVSLLGPSGCGKTTTLRMVAGFEYPTSGQVLIDGKDVTYTPPNKREIGIVFQSYSLFPHMRVSDNVAYGLKRRGVAKDECRERVREALELVDLAKFSDRLPSELSGGQQQRVALARAIIVRPKILLLDEPLSALDAKLREKMRFEIRQLQKQIGMTTILVTHDQEEALSMSDHIVVMNRGNVEQEGSPSDIYRSPRSSFVANFVGESNMIEGRLADTIDENGLALFEADCGLKMHVSSPTARHAGRRVLASLRPETVRLAASGSTVLQGHNVLQGKITAVNYLGARTLYQVSTATRNLLISAQNDENTPVEQRAFLTEGQNVAVSWSPTATQIVGAA